MRAQDTGDWTGARGRSWGRGAEGDGLSAGGWRSGGGAHRWGRHPPLSGLGNHADEPFRAVKAGGLHIDPGNAGAPSRP